MKTVHGCKTKNDKIDLYKIAMFLEGGNLPIACPCPAAWRDSQDLQRRHMYLSRRCSERVAHINDTTTQYNLPSFGRKLSGKYNHDGVAKRFEDPAVRKSVDVDLEVIDAQILKVIQSCNGPRQIVAELGDHHFIDHQIL